MPRLVSETTSSRSQELRDIAAVAAMPTGTFAEVFSGRHPPITDALRRRAQGDPKALAGIARLEAGYAALGIRLHPEAGGVFE
jgi:hypothetical protein